MEGRLLVLAVVLLGVTGGHAQLYEGDDCQLDDGAPGVCTTVPSCPGARELIIKGTLPKVCSFVQYSPIVCCRNSAPATTPTTTTATRRTTRRPTTARATTARTTTTTVMSVVDTSTTAGRKCIEYGRYVNWEVESPVLTIIPEKYNEQECAIVGQTLITGGVKAVPKEFPHMAALGFGPEDNIQWMCGGSLISERFVLTAAHCLSARSSGAVSWVRLGDLNLQSSEDNAEPVTIAVSERIKHPGYVPPAHYNDIALLKLESDVTFTRYIRPACLYTKPGNPPRMPNATASGWGKIEWTEEVGSADLMKVDLELQPASRCNHTFRSLIRIGGKLKQGITGESMICAGDPQGVKDTCGGDSGGPLQIRLKNPTCMYSIIGLTSFGVAACGFGDNPAVYTRVSHFIPWIESIVWP